MIRPKIGKGGHDGAGDSSANKWVYGEKSFQLPGAVCALVPHEMRGTGMNRCPVGNCEFIF